MYLPALFPEDGTPKPASASGGTYHMRHETAQGAMDALEAYAKANPGTKFSAWVLDEETGAVVCWCKYAPRPVIDWIDPSAIELQRMMKLGEQP